MASRRIQIIGLGTVGTAQAYLAQKLGHEVVGYDPVFKEHPYCIINGSYQEADITFICTPEKVVEEVAEKLSGVGGLIVIKSTVSIGTTLNLSKKIERHICYNPEFLRETHNCEDVIDPSRVVIGECCKQHGKVLERFYLPLGKKIYRTNPTTSEVIKLVSNGLRAINISLWNELSILCSQIGADIKIIAESSDPGKVLGEWEGGKWGTKHFGEPYGGKCLPKDIQHLICAFRDNGLNPGILEATDNFNNSIKIKELVKK